MKLARGLPLKVLVFIGEFARLRQHVVGHDVARFNPALSILGIAGAHAIPALLFRVVGGIRHVDLIEDIDGVAAAYLQQIRRHDGRRTTNLSAA